MGVVADGVEGGLQDAVLPRLGVLGHEEDVALTVDADLLDELVEASGVGKVDVGVGLDAVTVATADGELVPVGGEGGDLAILFPVAEAVEFERVDELAVDGEEVVDEDAMVFVADAVEVPEGVVEDDEDGGDLVQLREHGGELGGVTGGGAVFDRGSCEGFEAGHPVGAGCAGQVVNAEVEGGSSVGDGPLERDGDVAGGGERTEEERGLDAVVVGDGDEGGGLELVFDLVAFEVEGEARGEGRGPVAEGVVGVDAGSAMAEPFQETHDGLNGLPVGGELGDEVEGLVGLVGMAVEGYAGDKVLGCVGFTPQVRDTRLAHRGLPMLLLLFAL